MADDPAGLSLGQLLLALDATMVTLVEAPRGLDLPVASAALIDADDVRLGLAVGRRARPTCSSCSASSDDDALRWLDRQTRPASPTAIFVKEPSRRVVARAVARAPRSWPSNRGPAGSGCTGWSTTSSNITATAPTRCTTPAPTCSAWPSRSPTAPTAWSASRTRSPTCWPTRRPATRPTNCAGCRSWAAPGRPSTWQWIGPVGHLRRAARRRARWSASTSGPNWGCGRAWPSASTCRADRCAPRPGFAGTIWVQQGSRPLADDAEEVLRGGGGAGGPDHVAAGGGAVAHMPCGCRNCSA